MKRFEKNGYTLVFYQKENDKKFSFLIENEPELTEKLLNSVKTKRVKENSIKYAVKGIFEKLKNLSLINKNSEIMSTTNPITELAEKIQSIYGANIQTRVISKTGADHNPTITIEIELPNGDIYKASGSNKRIAKRLAAEKALEDLD